MPQALKRSLGKGWCGDAVKLTLTSKTANNLELINQYFREERILYFTSYLNRVKR